MNEELFFIQLRDCFTAGYNFPQFCIDNGIKNPLFIAKNENAVSFVWEVYMQFKFAKRIKPEFALLEGNAKTINFACMETYGNLKIKNISEIAAIENFDAIISLTNLKFSLPSKRIFLLDWILNYFASRAYAEIPLLHFLRRHSGIKLIVMNFPILRPDKNNSEFEKQLLREAGLNLLFSIRNKISKSTGEKISTPYDFFGYSNNDVYNLLEVPEVITRPDGSTYLKGNDSNPFMKIVDGKRFTAYQPTGYKNKIYFIGNCIYYGFGVPFDKTLESHLQKLLNIYKLPYRVENEAQALTDRHQDIFYNLNKLPVKSGDIVFVNLQYFRAPNLPFVDTTSIFKRPHSYGEIFADTGHINELGHQMMAGAFFTLLIQNNFFQNTEFNYPAPPPPPHRYGIPKENFFDSSNFIDNKDLEIYKQKLREKRLQIGAIVMNCNPFTLGHKTLIEYAAARVHKLYIFVVEEDKSEFKFADRLKLVQASVAEFPNVEVIPSGQFIISQKTFSGYFNKAELQNVQVDSSEDVEIFAREIAPTLGINIRFAGEEPEDTVTRQYNENMKNILPRYGIDFCEIPRRQFEGKVISAKSVREYLKVGDFEKIAKLVPKSTLDFLIENHSTPPRFRLTMIKFVGGIFIWLTRQLVINVRIAARR